jgi:hypothetical protein
MISAEGSGRTQVAAASSRAASRRAETSSRPSSNSEAYAVSVIAASLWPSIRCTCFTDTPDAIAKDAAVRRRS